MNLTLNNKNEKISTISFEGVKTFGKGEWKQFPSKSKDEKHFLDNAKALQTLIKVAQWGEENFATSQLEKGDFYVFVDNVGKPHIAVRMLGNSLLEILGLGKGEQEIEEEYSDVIIDFLEKNEDIENGKSFLEVQRWYKRLQEYIKQIESDSFDEKNIGNLLEDVYFSKCYVDFCPCGCDKYSMIGVGDYNSYTTAIKKIMPKLAPQIAKFYGCEPNEICFGSYQVDVKAEKFPYAVVFGDVVLSGATAIGEIMMNDISKLKVVSGLLNSNCKRLTSFPNLVCAKNIYTIYARSFPNLTKTDSLDIGVYSDEQMDIDVSKLQKVFSLMIHNVFDEDKQKEHQTIKIKLDSLRECSYLKISLRNTYIESLDKLTYCEALDAQHTTIKSMKNLTEVWRLIIDNATIENMQNIDVKTDLEIKENCSRKKGDITKLKLSEKDAKMLKKINSVGGSVFTTAGEFKFDEIKEKVINH